MRLKRLTVSDFVRIEDWQQLTVERHQSGTDQVRRIHQLLNDSQSGAHDFDVYKSY